MAILTFPLQSETWTDAIPRSSHIYVWSGLNISPDHLILEHHCIHPYNNTLCILHYYYNSVDIISRRSIIILSLPSALNNWLEFEHTVDVACDLYSSALHCPSLPHSGHAWITREWRWATPEIMLKCSWNDCPNTVFISRVLVKGICFLDTTGSM